MRVSPVLLPTALALTLLSACGGSNSSDGATPSPTPSPTLSPAPASETSASASPTTPSSPSTQPSTSAPTSAAPAPAPVVDKLAYLTQVEALCSAANDTYEATGEELAGTSTRAEATPVLTRLVAEAEAATKQITAVRPPAADTALVDTIFYAPLRTQVSELNAFLAALPTIPDSADAPFPALTSADVPAMKTYGFDSCITLANTE